jgi:carboxymethylenebutenolidase
LAERGYLAIAPHLFSRLGPGSWEDLAAAARAACGMPDAEVIGDVRAYVSLLRDQPLCNGKVGVIGFCSGGRHAYIMACKLDIDAAVDC